MRRTLILSAVCAGLSWPALSSPALAQRDAASKLLGDPYYFYAAKTYGNHAADHVHLLRQFVSTNRRIPTDWVGQHVGAIRSNVGSIGWAYAQLSPRIKDHPDGLEQLAEIQQQHAEVLEICNRLEGASAEQGANLTVISSILDQLQSSLSGARASQQELALEFGGDQ